MHKVNTLLLDLKRQRDDLSPIKDKESHPNLMKEYKINVSQIHDKLVKSPEKNI